jgi:predicted HicB family RNase H-like nuclease
LAEAFDRFDVDNTGNITKKVSFFSLYATENDFLTRLTGKAFKNSFLKDLIEILGKKRAALVDEIFDELKTTKAGEISYEEFLNLFSQRMGEEMHRLVTIMSEAHLMLDDEPSNSNSVHQNETTSEGKEDASSLVFVDH